MVVVVVCHSMSLNATGVLMLCTSSASLNICVHYSFLGNTEFKCAQISLCCTGYASPHHGAGSAGVPAPGPVAPLQQQLEHASQKAGFVDDKYKPRPQVDCLVCCSSLMRNLGCCIVQFTCTL